jgi:hypothetical protein
MMSYHLLGRAQIFSGLLLVVLLVSLAGPGLAEESGRLAGELERTLVPLASAPARMHLEAEVLRGSVRLGKGTIQIVPGEYTYFGLETRSGICRYFQKGDNHVCLLQVANETSLWFTARSGGHVPFPVVRIERVSSETFELNLSMNMSVDHATRSLDLFVHPETAAHLARRFQERFAHREEIANGWSISGDRQGSVTVLLDRKDGRISGAAATFPSEEQGDPFV